ncbi:hypothetical protein GDO78_015746 [Eleutherodactylus coqui]|uniref:Uncharacterized protein n=1 Tax=Eleutherodactylus coqui TaxID=57060 RepID=A0A8J6B258_ELECQ|nr:hypothetical protein GDO78_015746 [Eleutherodactylus coqui]
MVSAIFSLLALVHWQCQDYRRTTPALQLARIAPNSKTHLPISAGSCLILFSRMLSMVSFARALMSFSTVVRRLKRKKRVVRELSLYTTAGISRSLLCRRSSIRSFFRLSRESGRLVKEFSLRASVTKFTRLPTSAGSDGSLLPYK